MVVFFIVNSHEKNALLHVENVAVHPSSKTVFNTTW